jgi:DNA polymerase (family 10)
MPIHNSDIESMLNELADILEIEGANPFRVRAYRTGARAVTGFSQSLVDLVQQKEDLTRYSGIGKELAAKIEEIARNGTLSALEEARQRVSPELVSLLHIQGLGPKRVKALHEELKVESVQDLKEAAASGKIAGLSGFGKKTQDSILEEIDRFQGQEKRFKTAEVEEVAHALVEHLQKMDGVDQVEIAGSFRRRKDTVGDLDLLVTGDRSTGVMDGLTSYEDVRQVLSHGQTKSSVILKNELQVDVRFVARESFGAALHYFTGSKAHNIAVRKMALDRDLKVNEYGVFRNDELVAGNTEEEVYACVDLPYIEPELREDRGEFEAAAQDRLPQLITARDLRGDLHVHTRATDGKNTLEEMARAAREFGYEYLGITDHTRNLTMVHGLDPDRLARQIDDIDEINDRITGVTLLKGTEVDILENGKLDLPDRILERLDFCVCSVHTKFKLSRDKQTERVLRAMDNPNFTVFGHPSGRLIGSRSPYDLDMDRILHGALDKGCLLELNSQPDRLDIDDVTCKAAKDMGIKVVISTDAHRTADLRLVRFGLGQARRGWLEPGDVANTRPLEELRKLFRR